MSEISGVGLRTLRQFERGKGNPTLETLTKICDTLGLEIQLKVKNPSLTARIFYNNHLNTI